MDYNCGFPLTRTIEVMGKEITVKNYICSRDGGEYKEKGEHPRLQLSIIPTDFCDCNCPFCSAHELGDNAGNTKHFLDRKKLLNTLKELNCIDIVRGISITGGEPFTDIILLDDIISMCFEIFGKDMEISINTNGSGLKNLNMIKNLQYVDAIHISRHHYDEDINRELFEGMTGRCGRLAHNDQVARAEMIPTNAEIREAVAGISYKDIFVFNCLLLRDYIGTREEMHRFLDYSIEMGVPKVGFITAMEVNDFTKSQRVSYEDVFTREDNLILFTRCYKDFDFCRCQDGVYTSPNGGLCELYGRQTMHGEPEYVRGLVYGADNHLRTGYTGNIIS